MYGDAKKECSDCGREKYWYNYPTTKNGKIIGELCFWCIERRKRINVVGKILNLMAKAEKNRMSDLRTRLFECLEMVKNKELDIESAKAACAIAKTIINSAKVEIEFIKAIGGVSKSEFFQIEDK